MDSKKVRTALGKLQDNPDQPQEWEALRSAITEADGDLTADEMCALLEAAREKHAERGEWHAVSTLLDIAADTVRGTEREAALIREQVEVLHDKLFDDESATAGYVHLLELDPNDAKVRAALAETEDRRERYRDLIEQYVVEAEQAPDDVYKSSMLMRAAEMQVRFGTESDETDLAIDRLEQAVRLDPTNVAAGHLLEQVYRLEQRFEEQARVLERLADRSEQIPVRAAAGVRLARLYQHRLEDPERAARAYGRVLRDVPDQHEAMEYLSEFYSSGERWDELVLLYEGALRAKDTNSADRLGEMYQIAMLHWRKRGHAQDAEPWFDRIRKIDPAHDGMLDFFREYTERLEDTGRLIEVLQGAQRVLKDGIKKKAQIATEIARLAEGQENAQKAIEQYKSALRQDPDNVESREALKRLYKQTQGYNALVELLRQQLERTPQEDYPARLAILREVATVYRQYMRSDTALVTVLNQIVQLDDKLDEHDVDELRELVALYEKLSRWRDLLTTQQKLAEITPDVDEKKTLYREVARRWLDQFSNVQNATEAYAALYQLAPDDNEARERLIELYRKRRSWQALYDMYAAELEGETAGDKLALMREMAQLAAERLNRGKDAIDLYQRILATDPERVDVLDALERQAERAKDWATLASAFEQRAKLIDDPQSKLVVLQKLGNVYTDHLSNVERASEAWRRVLELQPGHGRALRVLRDAYLAQHDYAGLERLYASQNDWEGLAEVLSNAADRTKDDEIKVELSYRAADVYEQHLDAPDRAFRSYERVLGVRRDDERAVRALIPLYERDEKWARLPPLYETRLDQVESVAEKLELYRKLVDVVGGRLGDRKNAVESARRAYELVPTEPSTLELFEKECRDAGQWESFVEAIDLRLAQVPSLAPPPEPEPRRKKGKRKRRASDAPPAPSEATSAEKSALRRRLAKVYAEELGRIDQAIDVYKRYLEREPGDADAAEELETLLRRADRRDDLRWLLELRVEHASSDAVRVEVLRGWAELEEQAFDAPVRARDAYRRVLELDATDTAALTSLPRLLLAEGDAAGAARIIEQHRDQLEGAERAAREVELAELYHERLDRPEDALAAAERALGLGAEQTRARAVLEALVKNTAVRARAAELLAEEYAAGGEARHEAEALALLLEQTTDPVQELELFERLTSVYEEKLNAHGKAFDVVLKAVVKHPTVERLWDRADELAAKSGRPTELAEAYREVLRGELPGDVEAQLSERAARVHEERLGDPIGATPHLQRILAVEPGNEGAFRRLKDILTAAERWGELESLYDRASQATDDPARRTEMLVEVALICEEIIEDAEKATKYYERILELDPMHDNSVRALDRLYARQGRSEDLAALLERRIAVAVGDELLELKLRLAKLDMQLHRPEQAIVHVEDVLRERINDYEARELAERLLDIGTLRVRAARVLETVYEARDEIRDLVRVLGIRLEAQPEEAGEAAPPQDERRDLLRRISVLRDERLHDDDGSLDALSELVPLDPLDTDARERLLEVGRRLGAHERVATVLCAAADVAETPGMQGEILMQVAQIYLDLLGDSEKAERTYRRVLSLDENDAELVVPAAQALEKIYQSTGQHRQLAEMLKVQVKLEQEGDRRAELLGRLGELCESVLDDPEGAIEAWRARAEDLPGDEASLLALDRLYEETGSFRELVGVLERRYDVATGEEARRTLLTRSAEVLWKKLESVPEAIAAYQALVEEFGPSEASLTALEDLFQAAERWEELGGALEQHLDLAETDADRLSLLGRLGDLKREHLDDAEGALAVYRRALSIDSSHATSRTALEGLLNSQDALTRREAAETLHPIYETDGDHEKLLRVLEIEVGTADDALVKLERIEAAMRVAEEQLKDAPRAFEYAERAVRTAVGHTELKPYLDHLERLATATERHAEQVKLLCEVVPEIFDGEVQMDVTLKVAELARHRLADRELAREYYQKALELRADDRTALVALESLYEETGDAKSLLDVLERRVEVAEGEAERIELLFRRARLLSDVVGDARRAVEVYESILDLKLDQAAIEALERLYPAEQMWVELVQLYQRQLDAGAGNAADLHVAIAKVAARHQGDVPRAFDELELALGIEGQHAGAVAELERLLEQASEAEHRARAATLLEPVYLARADYGQVMNAFRARLEFTQDPEERRSLLTRLAKLYEEQQEDYVAALETTAKLLEDDVGNREVIQELERLAKVAGAERRLADIYAAALEKLEADDEGSARLARRTGELFQSLDDLEKSLSYYRRALGFDPESTELFSAVDAILERMERYTDRVVLYREALDHRFEPEARLKLLHTIATLEEERLKRPDDAIDTYRAALDLDEKDRISLDALTVLYQRRERFSDLAELYLRRAETAENPEEGAGYRLALAHLYNDELTEPGRAIDQLQEIVEAVPMHSEAMRELEALKNDEALRARVVGILQPLYESADDWRRLIHLNQDRHDLATEPADRVVVLRETAELWETRGKDLDRARRALALAFRTDPEDPEVRADYERLTEKTGAWDNLAETYETVLARTPDLLSKREILDVLARVHDERRDDPRSALDAYGRLHQVDTGDVAPLERMERLSMLLSDWKVLVNVLTAKADLVLDDEERASVWRRVGEAKRDMLEDREGAVEAYERALELDPESAFTLDCLIDLYESKGDAARLAELYHERVALTDDDDADLKHSLLVAAAQCHETQLNDPARAIEALNQALEMRPADPQVLETLNRLYRLEQMWPELLDNLRLRCEAAASPEARAALRREIGSIQAEKLDNYEDALEAYRQVLDEVPNDTESVEAVLRIGREHEEFRSTVAEVLVPVLEKTESYQLLVDVLELRFTVEATPSDRSRTLSSIADILEKRLGRTEEAQGFLLRALSEEPEAEDLHRDIERLSELCKGWERYADALFERAQSTFDPELAKELYTRLGRVANDKLEDLPRAVDAYVHALEQQGDQPELLEALDRLYERMGDLNALGDVLERRVVIETSEAEQAELYYRLARLQIHEFSDPGRGLSSLRMALERKSAHENATAELEALTDQRDLFEEASEILEGVYREANRTDKLASLYEKRVGFADTPEERIEMRRSLSRVLEEDAKDTASAQRVLQQGLADDPADPALLDEIERLAAVTGHWQGAARALEHALDQHTLEQATNLLPDATSRLYARLADWYRDHVGDAQAAEQALDKALEHEPANDDVLAALEQLQSVPGREVDLVTTLRRRAKLKLDDTEREEFYRRAKELCDAQGKGDLAEAVLRELLQQDDTNLWALGELTNVREAAGDYKETFALLVRRSELRAQGDVVRDLRRRAAVIARDKLQDRAQAIDLFEQIFDDTPEDSETANALRALYAQTGRWDDLGRFLERLIDLGRSPAERTPLRLELSRLNRERFEALDIAIELLRMILEEEPGHADAVVELSELYEKTQRDEELADLLNNQIEVAQGRQDSDAELRFEVRLGEVYETRLGDRTRAIDTYQHVLGRNPEHRGALEALARLYLAEQDHAKSAEVLEKLLGTASGQEAVDIAAKLSEQFSALGDSAGAARALERGLEADSTNPDLRGRLRELYRASEDWEKLAELTAKDAAFAAEPAEQVRLYREAATIHSERRSDHAAAAELLERASQLQPDDRELLLSLCDAYSASGRGKAAAEALERVVESYGGKRSKELGEIHRRLANAYLAEGETERAMGELDKAFRIEPGNVGILKRLGEVALELGDTKKAQQMFRALLLQKLDTKSPITKAEVFMRLGEVHDKLGEKSKAMQMLERAIQTDAKLEEAKKRLEELRAR